VDRPRASTALELLRICRELQGRYEEVEVPFLVVHGGGDVVCDPACVEDLYSRAGSKDKTLKIYDGMWHQLIGESEENVELVFGDILEWLIKRATVDGET
jgi:alpha-beta hydrolase superfamily lysophospholipase